MAGVLMTAAATAALASGRPAAGTVFAGKTSQGNAIRLKVVRGAGLQMSFRETLRCSRGPDQTTQASFRRDRPHIRPDGTFDYRKAYRNLPPVPGFDERHDEIQRITGRVQGRRITGRIRDAVLGRKTGLKCSVNMAFKARRSS